MHDFGPFGWSFFTATLSLFLDGICEEPKANTTQPARDVEKRLTRINHTGLRRQL
jgi:hypothetical protein